MTSELEEAPKSAPFVDAFIFWLKLGFLGSHYIEHDEFFMQLREFGASDHGAAAAKHAFGTDGQTG